MRAISPPSAVPSPFLSQCAQAEESPIAKALAALTATNHRPSPSSSSPSQPSSPAVPASHDNLVDSADVSLEGLSIELGPDLRAIYPVVLNFGLSGKVDQEKTPRFHPTTSPCSSAFAASK